MKVSEVKYRRVFNLGDYNSEEFGITVVLEEDETAQEAFKQCQTEVATARSGENNEGEETNEPAKTTKAGRTGKSGDKKGKDTDSDDDSKIEGEEETETEETEGDETEENSEDENEGEEEQESPPPGKKAAGKASGKSFKKKPQVYSRDNKAHKDIFASVLREVAPKWKDTPKSMAKGKKASVDLEDEDFLDADGEVLPAFRAQVKRAMK